MSVRGLIAKAAITGMLTVSACDRNQDEAAGRSPDSAVRAAPDRPAWRSPESSPLVAIPQEQGDAELTAAIAEARRTADAARERWLLASPEDRANWAVKWAAPTASGTVEHVWVRPLAWSPFRIEGRLANTPVAALVGGKSAGDLVSFPAEEMTDWVHLVEGTLGGPREGGFTMDVLGQRYGVPEAAAPPARGGS